MRIFLNGFFACLLLIGDAWGRDGNERGQVSVARTLGMNKKKSGTAMMKKKKNSALTGFVTEVDPIPIEEVYASSSSSKGMMMMKKSKKGGKSGSMMGKSKNKNKGASSAVFELFNSCVTEGNCIRATNNAVYDTREYCEWTISADATLSVSFFELEDIYDYVFVGNYSGFTGAGVNIDGQMIDGLSVAAGDVISFQSDGSNELTGFEICLV